MWTMRKYAKQFMGALIAPLFLANALSFGLVACPAQASEEAKRKVLEVGVTKNVSSIRDKWAVVIGVDNFKDKRIPQLHFSAKDAADFAKFLVEKANFAPDHVLLLLNGDATRDNIIANLCDEWLVRRADPKDLVLIYASSHGSPRELDTVQKESYLIAHDTNEDRIFTTGINLSDILATIKKRTDCERIVMILDACNSGAATGSSKGLVRESNVDPESIAGTGQIVISSSAAQQRSWESKRYQNGVFTRSLIETLGDPKSDLVTSFDSLKDKVQSEVKFDRKASQTPTIANKWEGDPLILAARPAAPQSFPDDDDCPYTYKAFVSGHVAKKAPPPEERVEPKVETPVVQTPLVQTQTHTPSVLPQTQPVVQTSSPPPPNTGTSYTYNYGSRAPEVQKKAAPVGKEADYWFKMQGRFK